MTDGPTLSDVTAYAQSIDRLVLRLRRLYRFSVSEALDFIELFGDARLVGLDDKHAPEPA